eukprot:gene31347-38724_t
MQPERHRSSAQVISQDVRRTSCTHSPAHRRTNSITALK